MKVFREIGSKERFAEVFQKVNKVQLNEQFGQTLNPQSVLEDAFGQLKNGNLTIKHSSTQVGDNESFVELLCMDRENNNITFTFKAIVEEGDQEGVFDVTGVGLESFSFDSAANEETVEISGDSLRQFNAQHQNEIYDVINEYMDVKEEVPAEEMDEIYEDAVRLIDNVPYKGGSERMQTHKAYADEKPTNPAVRVSAEELEKFLTEELGDDFGMPPEYVNPEDIEKGYEINKYSDTEEEPEIDPDTIKSPNDVEVSEDVKRIILQAYDGLVEKAQRERRYDYSPTQLEVEDEILRITGQKVVKEKKRVYPKEAEPFLEADITALAPDVIAKKSYETGLSQQKKLEYIEQARDYVEGKLGAETFFSLQQQQRDEVIADVANQIFLANLKLMNEGDDGYPTELGKEFAPKTDYPGKKKKYKSKKVKIKEGEDGENLLRKSYNKLHADLDFGKLATAYQSLLKLKRGEFRSTGTVQAALSSLRNTIATYLNQIVGLNVSEEDVQNYFENMAQKYSTVYEGGETENDVDVLDVPVDKDAEMQAKSDIAQDYEQPVPYKTDFQFNENKDEEMTDILLGYEPKNVGDGVLGVDESKENELKQRDPAAWHQVQIAKKTLRMPDAMLGVMGGQTKEEAVEILKKYGINVNEDYDFAAAEREYEDNDAYNKYQEYNKKDINTLRDNEKEEYFELWKQFKGSEKDN